MNVPRCMSTQHPDNVQPPFFADHPVVQGEAEIREAYYAYSHLGCTEQMWDYEGKEVDGFVVKKLLSRYAGFFKRRRLGQDLRLTLRVPNPRVEKLEAKVLLETLESIPRSFDTARSFYGETAPYPIFEVILPMTTSAEELNRVYYYYKEFVGGKEKQRCYDIAVGRWLGNFRPDTIEVIPLLEDKERLLEADRIVEEYLRDKDIAQQRVFLARSDPALNYGQIGAVLLEKVALQRLERLERKMGIEILPILGAGSSPFRGNLRPDRVREVLAEYPSVQTFTIQSAFKYDYPEDEVRRAVELINGASRGPAEEVDEPRCLEIIDKVAKRYAESVRVLAPLVNEIGAYVPPRRARKLHIGLFGYSRELNGYSHVHLPRAIKFCAALYSVGVPPEILGLSALNREELAFIRSVYPHLEQDMGDSLRYLNEKNLQYLPTIAQEEVHGALNTFPVDVDEEHREITGAILASLRTEDGKPSLSELITRAAMRRHFLG